MSKLLVFTAALAVGALMVSAALAAPFQKGKGLVKTLAPQSDWVEEIFIDYGPSGDTHAGPGPHPTTESADFHLTQGGIRWLAGTPIEYGIIGSEAIAGANGAIEAALATWDGLITSRTFIRDDATPTLNPCGGINEVSWAPIDGPGGALATASVCRNVATKEIRGFRVTMDTAEVWATDGGGGSFDVENVAAHEFGHVAGLGHDNSPKSGCLTMYRFAGLGEIQKRTLGLGDKLGLNALYSTGDVSSGPGCGS